jgi:hypothetical protein
MKQKLVSLLERLENRTCIGFTAGEVTGSVVDLEFEPRRLRSRPLRNLNLTEEQRRGEPEYSILIECAWRLDGRHGVICGAWDDNSPDGTMLRGLREIIGEAVESYQLSDPGLDLELRFSSGRTLRIFCDQVNEFDEYDNYSVFSPSEIIVVGTKSRLRREERHGLIE